MRKVRVLAIDDERLHARADVVARTYSEGLLLLEKFGPWDELILDHDLGAIVREFDDRENELNGYRIVCFLEANPDLLPEKIRLCTSNGTGMRNIASALNGRVLAIHLVQKTPTLWVRRRVIYA